MIPDRERRVLDSARTALRASASDASAAGTAGRTLLFAGGPGTGKTMAAQLLAAELERNVLELDLPSISSQPRGEAESAIDRVLDEARRSGAIVVLDRAEALVEGRSGGVLSRDRGTARGLADLLEKARSGAAVAILTSRLSPKLEPSLREGVDFVIEFPFPWSDARRKIWQRLLPDDAEVSDSELDFLAASFKLPGATIKRCCLGAARSASEEHVPVRIAHVARALEHEYRGRVLTEQTRGALESLLSPDGPRRKQPDVKRQPAAAKTAKAAPAPAMPPPASPTPPPPLKRTAPRVARPVTHGLESTRGAPLRERIAAALGHAPADAVPASSVAATRAETAKPKPEPVRVKPATVRERPPAEPAPAKAMAPSATATPTLSSKWAGWALVGIVAAAAIGFAVARATTSSSPPAEKHALAGPVRFSFPGSWRYQRPPSTPLGLSNEVAVGPSAGGRGTVIIGISNVGNGNLLPRPLLGSVSARRAPEVVSLGGIGFYRYPAQAGSVFAAPTTSGAIVAVCMSRGAAAGFGSACDRVVATLGLTSGRLLPPGQSAGYAAALNGVMQRLSAARAALGARLHAARTARAQATAARELAAAHTGAAAAVARLSAGPAAAANSALVRELRTTAAAYAALSAAAAAADVPGYLAASKSLTHADSRLAAALQQLGTLGYRVG